MSEIVKLIIINLMVVGFLFAKHVLIKLNKYQGMSSIDRIKQGGRSTKNDVWFWLLSQTLFPIAGRIGVLYYLSVFGILSEVAGYFDIFDELATLSLMSFAWEWVGDSRVLKWLVWFVAIDFCLYLTHVIMHRYFWTWHKFHHAAEEFCVFTTARFALSETIFGSFVRALIIMCILGLPEYETVVFLVASKLIFEWLHHSNLPWDYGRLGRIFVSPRFHRFHHSIEAEDRDINFGADLAIWDYMFGTISTRYRANPSLASDTKIGTLQRDSKTILGFLENYLPEVSYLRAYYIKLSKFLNSR